MKKLKFLLIFIFGFISLSFADETLTITTYYPSPYGSYQDLYVANKLGIGTTSPGANLEVWGSSPTLKITQNAGVAGSALLMLTQAGGGGNTAGIGLRGGTNYIYNEAMDAYKIVFGPNLVFANAKMVVDINTGKVGIGTTGPAERLDVGGGNVKMGYEQVSVQDPTACNNCWRTVTATCSSGKYVIGGGCGGSPASGSVAYSKPGDNSSWSCGINIGSTISNANAYAICANIR